MNAAPRELVAFQADVIKALGHPLRIEIVNYLKSRERAVSEIVQAFDEDPSNISRHLAILKRAGILAASKHGLNVHYRVAMTCVPEFLAEIERHIRRKFER